MQICHKISDVSIQNRSLVSKYRREMLLRKKLHNKLVELRGNIRVLCRVRPPIQEDGDGAAGAIVVETDTEDDGVVHVLSKGSWKPFTVDRVFGPRSAQKQVKLGASGIFGVKGNGCYGCSSILGNS